MLPSSFLLLLSSVYLLAPEEEFFCVWKALVYYCCLVFRRIGEYISLHLFYFVNLTSSCSLTLLDLELDSYVDSGRVLA